MNKIDYYIELKSDAEPGSGFGTERVDDLLPRDVKGRVILPSTHIKGLMRENLEALPEKIAPSETVAELFGSEDDTAALFHLDNATAPLDAEVMDITRTRLNPYGITLEGSLRTSEAVAAGTVFKGTVRTRPGLSKAYQNLIKLGLLTLFSIGGGRNRGSGACFVTIGNENRTPGEIIRELSEVNFNAIPPIQAINQPKGAFINDRVILKMVFKADDPVCVPETPIVKNNMISSGFSIPASAVQGAILHRINDISNKTATACYNSSNFRAWSLNPANSEDTLSLRVSFTHKISKLKLEDTGNYHFEDETVRPYDWDKIPSHSPLKASDGVLLVDGTIVKLWKSSDMARIITAHGVHNGDREGSDKKRNLFTVEALAPMIFTGLVSIPKTAADLFIKSIEADPFMQFGKSRSVRGGGLLYVERINFDALPLMKKYEEDTFIVQSPLLVPLELSNKPVEEILSIMVADAKFGDVEKCSGTVSIQFGWNRTVNNGFIGAKPVIVPGAVFKLKSPVKNLEQKLVDGIGEGRENGFGAVLPHPGVAERLFPDEPTPRVVKRVGRNYGKEGFDLWKKAKESNLSASQISRVRELTGLDPRGAISYLQRQKADRPGPIWDQWKGVTREIELEILENPEHMQKVLKVCQDLLVADKGES